ncbi:MAG: hypothetical protein M3T49_10045 [Candidatus Eremiobacteraeota bacterium]|nr:hypothetical protein [Candidatus Eremiobacteraeota bacterium]
MKRFNLAAVIGLAIAAAACGGGGGGSSPGPPPISYANTALPYYLPLAAGNQWKFANGGVIDDTGPSVLSCNGCAYDGGALEDLDVINPSGAYALTFYFAKASPFGTNDTFLVAFSSDHGSTITLIGPFVSGNVQVVPGIGVISDTPQVNQSWSDNGLTSVIQSVGGTQSYGSNQQIKNIAVDTITGVNNGQTQTITWGFAQGVGFTSINFNGQSALLTSFSVSTTGSHSAIRKVIRSSSSSFDRNSLAAALRRLGTKN